MIVDTMAWLMGYVSREGNGIKKTKTKSNISLSLIQSLLICHVQGIITVTQLIKHAEQPICSIQRSSKLTSGFAPLILSLWHYKENRKQLHSLGSIHLWHSTGWKPKKAKRMHQDNIIRWLHTEDSRLSITQADLANQNVTNQIHIKMSRLTAMSSFTLKQSIGDRGTADVYEKNFNST